MTFSELPDYVTVIRKAVKRLSLRINDDGSVRLTLPQRCPEREAIAFYQSRLQWIDRHRAGLAAQPSGLAFTADQVLLFDRHYQFIRGSARGKADVDHAEATITTPLDLNQSAQRLAWYRSYAKRYLPPRLLELAQKNELPIGKVTIRDQRSRWGSCSTRKNISLNWRLVLMPTWVSDAVLLHELSHTKEMNHGPKFYQLVNRICPEHEQSGIWLKQYGAALMRFGR